VRAALNKNSKTIDSFCIEVDYRLKILMATLWLHGLTEANMLPCSLFSGFYLIFVKPALRMGLINVLQVFFTRSANGFFQ
jgi:hypothetical protein